MEDVVSYCSSKNRPALEAVGVVIDFVVVSESNTKAANDNFFDSGVLLYCNKLLSTCDLIVVFPVPDSPLRVC